MQYTAYIRILYDVFNPPAHWMHITTNATCEIEQLIKCRIFKSFEEKPSVQNCWVCGFFFQSPYCLLALVLVKEFMFVRCESSPRRHCVVLGRIVFTVLRNWICGKRRSRVQFVTLDQSKISQCMRLSRLYRVFHGNFFLCVFVWFSSFVKHWKTSTTMLTWLACYPRSSYPTALFIYLSPRFSHSLTFVYFGLFISVRIDKISNRVHTV